MAGPFPMPPTTVNDLLLAGRSLLLDPSTGPFVPPQNGVGNSLLQDVRVRGKNMVSGESVGTQGWIPGSTGFPCAVLTAYEVTKSYKETGHVWEEWTCFLHLALSNERNAETDYHGWAIDWDAQLTQWYAGHRRFGLIATQAGDVYWEYRRGIAKTFALEGVIVYGLTCQLHVHNVAVVTWGV